MNLKAVFPSGTTDIVVNGLHQWDYGRVLEIHADDLPALVEVHFACAGMRDAVVRSCPVVAGVAEAAIPDQCLEQHTPVLAWVYVVDDTAGTTVLSVTMPIIARTRPQSSATVPTVIGDKYTELVAAINTQIGALADGRVIAARSAEADHANEADHAETAMIANGLSSNYFKRPSSNVNHITEAGYYYAEIYQSETSGEEGYVSFGLLYWSPGRKVETSSHSPTMGTNLYLTINANGYISVSRGVSSGYQDYGSYAYMAKVF